MLENLSKKINIDNIQLKNISKCFESITFIINNTKKPEILNQLKMILKDVKAVMSDLETDITNLENLLSSNNTEDLSLTDNNTLLISAIQEKVFLPYSISDLQKILENDNKFNDYQEIIDNYYTIPITKYKNSTVSRFKETFNLMRKKEHSSILDSLNLAFELSVNTLLNPAIITACKNLDELDVYLDCLSSNELDKFQFFDIKYEILPYKINRQFK